MTQLSHDYHVTNTSMHLPSQYLDMKEKFAKSGAGGRDITQDDFSEVEWLALDYLGVACIEGRVHTSV